MSNINKQALIAKIKKQAESFDTVVLREDEANALLDELEAAEKQILKLEKLAESESVGADKAAASCVEWMKRCHDAEKRIAELEAREIYLPERSSMLHRTDFNEDYHTVMAFKASDVIAVIRAAGIRIKGE